MSTGGKKGNKGSCVQAISGTMVREDGACTRVTEIVVMKSGQICDTKKNQQDLNNGFDITEVASQRWLSHICPT